MKTARGNGKQVYEKIKEINGGYCMTEKLKPCPFCGDEAEVRSDENGEYYVSCTGCFTLVGYCTDTWAEYNTETEAIAAWNRRVNP